MFRRFFQRNGQGQTPTPQPSEQPGSLEALSPEQIVSCVMQLLKKYTHTYVFSEQGRAEINRFLPLLAQAYRALSNEPTSQSFLSTASVYVTALRKVGSFEEAARIARTLPMTFYPGQVALAMAEKALGNLDASQAAYQRALALKPNHADVRDDLGTLLLSQGKLAEALAFFEESARLDPSDPFQDVFAHIAYLQYLQASPSEGWLEQLKKLARQQKATHRLFSFLQMPYLGILPVPGEALMNLMRGTKARIRAGEIKAGGKTGIGLSLLEAPSATLAAKRMLETLGTAFSLSVSDVISPDPRQPLRPVQYQIWRYEGFDPLPAVAPPDPTIAEQIATLAQVPYALDRWHAPARELGERLGREALMDLLAVMVHPPVTPAGWDEWDWLVALQIASALALAYIDTGWEGSRRKAALTSLVYGPMDWSGAAALIALAVLARQDKRIHIEFDRICCDLWRFGRGSAEWPHEQAMVSGLLFLNEYSDEARAHLNAYFRRMQEGERS
jgi:hypothetical protein